MGAVRHSVLSGPLYRMRAESRSCPSLSMSARTSKASPTTRLTGYRPASSSGRTHSITRDAGERGVVTLVERRRLVVEAISEFGNARSRQRTREGKDRRIPAAATGVAFARRRPSAGHHGNEEYHE